MGVTYDFEGSVVPVTGASGALGGATAEAFDGAGATVCGADIADVVLFLCSPAATVTSGAAVPVYGES